MTREEAINILKQYREKPTLINEIETVEEAVWLDEALDMAVNALEQEPKTGHWIVYTDCEGKTRRCVCDRCGHKTGEYTWKNPNFCENCGAKMESEDKE